MTSRLKGRAVPERPADAIFTYLTTQEGLVIERWRQGWVAYWRIEKERTEESLLRIGYSSAQIKEAMQDWLVDQGEYDSMSAAAIAALRRRFDRIETHEWCVAFNEYYVIRIACEDRGMWIEELSGAYEAAMEEPSGVYGSTIEGNWAYGWNKQIGWAGFPTEGQAIAAGIIQLFTLLRDAGVALPANTDQKGPAYITDALGFDEAQPEQEST